MDATDRYADLVRTRKRCQRCLELTNPSNVAHGRFDSDHVGPWTRWQGNLEARLMVVGQDWGDSDYFERHEGWDREVDNPTNRRLRELCESIGVRVPPAELDPDPQIAFFTNAILCLKPPTSGFQGPVERAWFANCRSYLRSQIEIVRPSVVVGLGQRAHESVLVAFGKRPVKPFRLAVADEEGSELIEGTRAFAVYHCGNRGVNFHRPFDEQLRDWVRIGRALSSEAGGR